VMCSCEHSNETLKVKVKLKLSLCLTRHHAMKMSDLI
jgi:hypothetical protein